jgi:hypothetical protein
MTVKTPNKIGERIKQEIAAGNFQHKVELDPVSMAKIRVKIARISARVPRKSMRRILDCQLEDVGLCFGGFLRKMRAARRAMGTCMKKDLKFHC